VLGAGMKGPDTEAAALTRENAQLAREQSARLQGDANAARQIVNRDEYVVGSKDAAASAAAKQAQAVQQQSGEVGGATAMLEGASIEDPTAGVQAQRKRQDEKQILAQQTDITSEQAAMNANTLESMAAGENQVAKDTAEQQQDRDALGNEQADQEEEKPAAGSATPLNFASLRALPLNDDLKAKLKTALDALPVDTILTKESPELVALEAVLTEVSAAHPTFKGLATDEALAKGGTPGDRVFNASEKKLLDDWLVSDSRMKNIVRAIYRRFD
jgi:hypothetical protein